MFLATDHHVEDVKVARWDHLDHHLQQRAAELPRWSNEQGWPNAPGNAWLIELGLDEVSIAERVKRVLVWDAVLVSARRPRHRHG